jgi:hypothetical protein
MNSDVHPLIVALVLVLTATAAATWMWASGEAASIGGPAELRSSPDGHHYIQIQNSLVEHDADGNYVETHDLEALGVELFLGTYAFFSNGDILLRLGPDPRSFGDNLRAYRRKTNLKTIEPETPDSGLYRCNLDNAACDRFGTAGIDIKAAYGVFVDWHTDNVYIADTTRHVLRIYSAAGDELAQPAGGFKFPNQLVVHDGRLLVADTNHHAIRVVSPQSRSFADFIESIDVVPNEATFARQTWPSHFIRVGDEWWVNNMQTGMNHGGLYVFDDSWHYVRKVDLPLDADPISLLRVNDQVWVTDWENDRVRRFSTSGEALPDLDSSGLEAIVASSRLERRRYELLGYGGVALFVLVLLGLMLRAFAVSMTTERKRRPGKVHNAASTGNDVKLFLQPDDKALRRTATAVRIAGLLALIIAALAVYIVFSHGAPAVGIPLIVSAFGLLAIVLLIAWVNKANVGTSITLDGNRVTLRDHTGRNSSCYTKDLRYDDTAIATKDAVVFLGRPMASVYERKSLQKQLLPRIEAAQKVNPWTMIRILTKLRHPQGVVTVFSAACLVLYFVYLAVNQAGWP